jgi:hypothetical protein
MKDLKFYQHLKIWYFSDTHSKHGFLDIPDDIDFAIFGGDGSIQKEPAMNNNEMLEFLSWFASLVHIKYKIMIGGNHDTSLEKRLIRKEDIPEGIIYLEHESITNNGFIFDYEY